MTTRNMNNIQRDDWDESLCNQTAVCYQTCTVSPNYPHLLLMFHTQNGHQSRFFWPRHQPAAVCLQRHLLWISHSGLVPPLPPQAPNHPAYLQSQQPLWSDIKVWLSPVSRHGDCTFYSFCLLFVGTLIDIGHSPVPCLNLTQSQF